MVNLIANVIETPPVDVNDTCLQTFAMLPGSVCGTKPDSTLVAPMNQPTPHAILRLVSIGAAAGLIFFTILFTSVCQCPAKLALTIVVTVNMIAHTCIATASSYFSPHFHWPR